ncbi:MAG: flagellar protein FliT [Gammaproteobacteria bacterium]|jgi:hypothetical protein|nr:flagellar protein FliT [Gammaproteobacteria bacterium]
MLRQALQLSEQMVAMVESGDDLDQLEQLELQRKSILARYIGEDNGSLQPEDGELLRSIQQLNRVIRGQLHGSRIKVRDQLVQGRKNKRQIQAYG